MNVKKLVGTTCLAVVLSACGSIPLNEAYGPLVGKNIRSAIAQMGKPDNVYTQDGTDFYSWKVQRQAGGFTGAMFGGVFGFTQRGTCLITITADHETHKITSYGSKAIDGKPGACEQDKDDDDSV